MTERKHYIDNLRNMTILLLFPVHTFMIWNDFGSQFYIWLGESKILSTCIVLINPWFMPLLFVLAGISARYALEKRSTVEFIRQRIEKLLVPFLAGMVLLVPFQTLYARKFFGGYSIGKNLALYLIGYYVLSNDKVMERLDKCKKLLLCLFVIITATSVTMYYTFSYYGDLWVNFVGWISILFLLVLGKNHWNKRTAFSTYFNQASYPIYILHQSILVALAYYVAQISENFSVQVMGILFGSFLVTVLAYHLIRWIPCVRKIVGIV